jgi:ankyrin repeat protein
MGQVDSCLFHASEEGDLNKAIRAIEEGANVNAIGAYLGDTPLHKASKRGHENVVSLLLENGANVNAKGFAGRTPLHKACEYGYEAVVSILLEYGADVNVKNDDGWTPLHYASEEGQDAIVSLLLENGANANAKGEHGLMPLHLASSKGHEAVVAFLLEKGADINVKDTEGRTPFYIASCNGHEAVVSLLLENGADINVKDMEGRTPFYIASKHGHEAVVSLLLEKGADPTITNNMGKTPLQIAQEKNNQSCVTAITEFPQRQAEKIQKEAAEKKQQFQDECLEKFKTRAALQREMQRLQEIIDAAEDSLDPIDNSNAENAKAEYEKLLPLFSWPQYMPVSDLEKEIQSLELQIKLLRIGPEKTLKTHELYHLRQRLEQEQKDSRINDAMRKELFFRHFDNMKALMQQDGIIQATTIVPIFENALKDMSDFLQLKLYFTAVNAQYRLGTITSDNRKALILSSLEKAKNWCVSPFHVAMYRVALRYALSEKIITHVQYDILDVDASAYHIANTNFIQEMQTMIRQNSVRIDRLEDSLQSMYQDMNRMAEAINDTQAAFNNFKAMLARKERFKRGCHFFTALLDAISLGVAGSALQDIFNQKIAEIADFGDLDHLRLVFSGVSKNFPEISEKNLEIGETSIHEMLEKGICLVESHPGLFLSHATDKLDAALVNENAIVVMGASAALFKSSLELDAKLSSELRNAEPSKEPPFVSEQPKDYDLSDAAFVQASPSFSSDDLETKLASLERKRERLINRAKVAKEFGRDVDPILEAIEQIDMEIDEVDDQIHNS